MKEFNIMAELFKCMIENDSKEGLYLTCRYLKTFKTDDLENAWIMMTSYIGKHVNSDGSGAIWYAINSDLIKLIESDKVRVPDALVMTTKLFLLYQKVATHKRTEEPIKQLRDKVINNFPETAALSSTGTQQFARILPSITEESYIFYSRILASLTRLMVENETDCMRDSLEFLTRKKNKMILPNNWPTPNIKEGKKGDAIWFLWGALLLYYNDDKVATFWKLFLNNWKASMKEERIGLLWGFPYCINNNTSSLWMKEDLHIIDKIVTLAPALWDEILNEETGSGSGSPENDGGSLITNFYPRKTETLSPPKTQRGEEIAPNRILDINTNDDLNLFNTEKIRIRKT